MSDVTAPEPFDEAFEKKLSAGYALFELCEDEDAALTDDWGDNEEPLKVAPGRVGVVSGASDHTPEIALASFTSAPGPIEAGFEEIGRVEVEWHSDRVELWTSDSDIGRARQLRLPPSSSGRYRLRASRAFSPKVTGSLKDYLDEHPNKTKGLELWRFDIWPA